MDKMLFLK